MSMVKTVCPVSRGHFKANAPEALAITIGGQPIIASKREFKKREGVVGSSFGYYANGKVTFIIGGVPVTFQVGVTVTAVGSKLLED